MRAMNRGSDSKSESTTSLRLFEIVGDLRVKEVTQP